MSDLPYGQTLARPTPNYELQVWQRTPVQASAATFTEVGRVVSPTITWADELDADGRLDCSCQPDRLDADVKAALRDAADKTSPQGVELRLVSDGTTIWAGPLVGGQIQGRTLTLTAHGLAYYLRYMWVTSDLTYSAVDQYTIGKGLVDHWQALDYGHFAIDTSSVGTSGTTRDRTYLAAEQHNVHKVLSELAAVDGGFNWWVDPSSRELTFGDRGTDLSATVVLDFRNVANASIAFDTAAGAFASEGFGTGTSSSDVPSTSTRSDTGVRASFGRAGVAASFDGVSDQSTLDAYTQQLVDDHSVPTFVPGPEVSPVTDADVGDFGPGDIVTYSFDSGLGLQTFARRLVKVQTSVGPDGSERMTAEFV